MSLWTRIRNAFSDERLNRDLEEEIRLHIAEAVAAGRSEQEARRAFGHALQIRESSRDAKIVGWLEALVADARFGWRQLRKNWKASGAAILSLALAIGACTGAFRLIDAVLLRPLPVAEPQNLYYLTSSYFDREQAPRENEAFSYPLYRQMREAVQGDADLLAISFASRNDLTYAGDDAMEKAYRQFVSGNTFPVFGLRPALGRLLGTADDVKPGAHPVAVLSHDYWSSRFGRDPNVIGRKFRIGEQLYSIVGVAPPGFTGTEPGAITAIFVPTMMNAEAIDQNGWQWFRIWVRPHQGQDMSRIRDRLQAVYTVNLQERLKSWRSDMPAELVDRFLKTRIEVHSAAAGASDLQKDYGRALVILGVLVGLILLIACANVANLLSAQAAVRSREMALRVSIGAGRGRLIQLVLVESALISLAAILLGGLFAWWSAPWVASMVNSRDNPLRLVLSADWRVLGFAVLLATSATILFGIVPALRASAVQPVSALKGEDRRSKTRLMHTLVAAQIAFCFLVHFVAGLFVGTFQRLSSQPTGFSANGVLLLETVVKGHKREPFETWRQIAEHLRAMPGVKSVAICGWPLMSGNAWSSGVRIAGRPIESFEPYFLAVGPGFLNTMGIELIAGRDFAPADPPGDSKEAVTGAAIVSEAFARRYFQGQNPVGRFFERVDGKNSLVRHQIIGYMRDVRYRNMRESMQPIAFVPVGPNNWGTFAVRTSAADPAWLAPALRAQVTRARSELRVSNVTTQQEMVDHWTRRERLLATLSLFFAILALILAGLGLYGVLNYSVLQRRREIGIRMALGARPSDVVRGVTAQVLAALLAGSTAGLAAGFSSERFLRILLYSVKPTDATIIATPLISLLVAALLAALPAVIRAVRIDPAETLRAE